LTVGRRDLEQRRGDIGAGQGIELSLDIGDESRPQKDRRAESGCDEPYREQCDGDAGDLRAQADATPPSGDRIRLLRVLFVQSGGPL